MTQFGEIRKLVLNDWNEGMTRNRIEGEFSDDYSESAWCKIQEECTDNGKHCSFICSLGDWLDNISDLLHDNRFDKFSEDDYQVMFRYYTRILLLISEVIEDFITVNKQILNLNSKKDSSRNLENGMLATEELKKLSEFINSVCKHKTQDDNLHVNNHHFKIEFSDFGAVEHENQMRLNNLIWKFTNHDTTILMPSLSYFIGLVVKINNKVLHYINNDSDYKTRMLELYADEWTPPLIE